MKCVLNYRVGWSCGGGANGTDTAGNKEGNCGGQYAAGQTGIKLAQSSQLSMSMGAASSCDGKLSKAWGHADTERQTHTNTDKVGNE